MREITWATPLYEFLRRCNASSLERNVLDCGAGGNDPPLALFYQYGYRTCGIEIAEGPREVGGEGSWQRAADTGVHRVHCQEIVR